MKHSKRLAPFTVNDDSMMIQLHLAQPQLPQDILLSRHFFQLSFFCQDIFSTTEWLMYSGLLDEALLEVGPNLGGGGVEVDGSETLNNHLGCKNSVVNTVMRCTTKPATKVKLGCADRDCSSS